jgi:peptidyl-prolyl cis-trans isomerase SurA
LIQTLKRQSTLLLALAILSLAAGCNHKDSDKDVVAKVNGYKILRSELDKAYNIQTAGAPQKLSPGEEQLLRLNLLHQLIDIRLQLQRAEKLGIVAKDDEVDAKFNEARAPYTKEEFEKTLKDSGRTEDDYRQEISRNLTIERLLNKEVVSRITISDADIQSYYNQHKSDFNVIEPRYDLAHIVVTAHPGPQPSTVADKAQNEAQARKKIEMIRNRLDSGEDFSTLAVRYSEDPNTASSGGELGPTPESQIRATDPMTREAILNLKPNQYTQILPLLDGSTRQPVGFQIVKLGGKESAGQKEFSDPNVQQRIRKQLRGQRELLLRGAYEESLHNGADIQNYYAEEILKNAEQK